MKTLFKIATPILVVLAAIAAAIVMTKYGDNGTTIPPKL